MLLFCSQHRVVAQQYQEGKMGFRVGVILSLGTHINRFGGVVNANYVNQNVQLNSELRIYFNAKNLGPNKSSVETVLSLGTVYGFGKKDSVNYLFYHPVSNQTQHQKSVGYAYRFYFSTLNTHQKTGLIAIEINQFSFIAENDLFAQPKLDRYRTGAFLLQYQKNNYQLAVNTTLFTGEMGERVVDKNYPLLAGSLSALVLMRFCLI